MTNNRGGKHCHQCGRALGEDARYCPECGTDQALNEDAGHQDDSGETDKTGRIQQVVNNFGSKDRKITVGRILAWIFAPLLILGGLGFLATDPLAGLITLVVGIFALPTTRSRIHENYNISFSRWIVVGVVIVGMFTASAFIDTEGENAGPGEVEEPESAEAEAEAAADAQDESASTEDDASGSQDESASGEDDGGGSQDESTNTAGDTADSEDAAAADGDGYQVRVLYDGNWNGAVGAEGATRSVDGSGEETLDVADDAMIVTASIQKQDASGNELTVQILEDGEVLEEQSTTAEYGVVSISSGP